MSLDLKKELGEILLCLHRYGSPLAGKRMTVDEAEIAILSLFQQVLRQVRPEKKTWGYGDFPDEHDMSESQGWNSCLDQLDHNIKQVLGGGE